MRDPENPLIPSLTNKLLGLLAVAAGLTVANNYYNQALLVEIGREFRLTAPSAGGVAVATQLGFASGLLLLVPLGDRFNRKTLILASAGAAALASIAVALSPGIIFALAASYFLGFVCITPQLIVPYAANLARPERRGRAVGIVMSGLLIGILFSRSVAGFLGHWLGWREILPLNRHGCTPAWDTGDLPRYHSGLLADNQHASIAERG